MNRFQSLTFRLKFFTLLWIAVSVASIVFTLYLSLWLEGNAAAINDLGSLRFQSYRLALLAEEAVPQPEIDARIGQFDEVLAAVRRGDPQRPLSLPDNPQVMARMAALETQWRQEIKPVFQAASAGRKIGSAQLDSFLHTVDDTVAAVERTSAAYITWLRIFQSALLALVLVSSAVMVWLTRIWIIAPLQELLSGVQAVRDGDFGVQMQAAGSSEFAEVNSGFNQMSARLSELYGSLEQQVAEKTQDLERKNFILGTLYAFSSVLGKPQSATEASEVFLERLMKIAEADAGSVRLTDPKRQRMDLAAQISLPQSLQQSEACSKIGDCFCGAAVQNNEARAIRFYDTRPKAADLGPQYDYECRRHGFADLRVLPIRYKEQDIGIATLYYRHTQEIGGTVGELLELLCSQFGVVVTNSRLGEESRQLAVLQERNLIAQGLHDSIAQTLAFLNLQVQMLESALDSGSSELAGENLQFIKSGVQECYDDVRELLLNFRTKIGRRDFAEAADEVVARFRRQTGTEAHIVWTQDQGMPLSSDQQLQCIFILQESLSNIRKHARAARVDIEIDNGRDFVMTITDNGIGFDAEHLEKLSGNHVGLNIMKERAARIRAQLNLASQPGQTRIRLILPAQERHPA
ncbi:Nitrate/nitrite sensor protein narX [Kingella potus]|uniref:Sensor protein n=1 Tax=Kingella potus TaxID=265175 RepID=A0A377R5N3_9NEIS|nr:type IV pili methyl-accepting chemotaxis transducer N-terminal domain-containing protein [Kingella potus]STR03292.1 Nitrate/nitrite sensor protein narX [Kingella potus]